MPFFIVMALWSKDLSRFAKSRAMSTLLGELAPNWLDCWATTERAVELERQADVLREQFDSAPSGATSFPCLRWLWTETSSPVA